MTGCGASTYGDIGRSCFIVNSLCEYKFADGGKRVAYSGREVFIILELHNLERYESNFASTTIARTDNSSLEYHVVAIYKYYLSQMNARKCR